ncbi:MAG: sulfate transporter CysZ [Nitrospirae bacterium]|nr:MAG: sulfate transporter CysZ [Nitrospirota bacterium]
MKKGILRDLYSGFESFFYGLKGVRERKLRTLIIIPVLLSVVVMVLIFFAAGNLYDLLLEHYLPDKSGFFIKTLRTILWVMFWVGFILLNAFLFTVLANLISSPFNAVISRRVLVDLLNKRMEDSGGIITELKRTIPSELRKILYFLPRWIFLLILGFIPVLNIIIPFLLFLFTAWSFGFEYLSYPMENDGIYFRDQLEMLRKRRYAVIGFGAAVSLGMSIPLINLLVIPVSVIGATHLWVKMDESRV